jgi:hypothetical protein
MLASNTGRVMVVPQGWPGSESAWIAYKTITSLGKDPQRDFRYHPRAEGDDADFTFISPPNLALRVQESFYDHHSGVETRGTDIMKKAQMAGNGVTLITLDHAMLQDDPEWLITEALQYRDHSME